VRRVLLGLLFALACNRLPQSPECAQYISCAEAVDNSVARQVRGQYGESGTCWSTNPITAGACTNVCIQQLELYRLDAGMMTAECALVTDAGQ
jgi:hypothetical protein